MFSCKRVSVGGAVLAIALPASLVTGSVAPASASRTAVLGGGVAASTAPATGTNATERALLASRELWATIDVCSPHDQPDTVGVRGSMPGDSDAQDQMYMAFHLQYMKTGKRWVNLASGSSSGWDAVGNGASARQGGTSFSLAPAQGKPAVTLRGVVMFQWRHGKTVLYAATRTTSTGHRSRAGADPANYSAGSCVIG
jgi:hypothetical protein